MFAQGYLLTVEKSTMEKALITWSITVILPQLYRKIRPNVTVGGVTMFVVAGCLTRSGRTGFIEKIGVVSEKAFYFDLYSGCRPAPWLVSF
jgi:hypothetical protein